MEAILLKIGGSKELTNYVATGVSEHVCAVLTYVLMMVATRPDLDLLKAGTNMANKEVCIHNNYINRASLFTEWHFCIILIKHFICYKVHFPFKYQSIYTLN